MRVYRLIEYECGNSESAKAWLQRTLERSIDGVFELGAMRITVICVMPAAANDPDFARLFDAALEQAREQPWARPSDDICRSCGEPR